MIVLYVTCPSEEEAEKISKGLLEENLVACTNVYLSSSNYFWEGQMKSESEHVVFAKTTKKRSSEAESLIKKLHPYKVPCILQFEAKANKEYEDWVIEETTKDM